MENAANNSTSDARRKSEPATDYGFLILATAWRRTKVGESHVQKATVNSNASAAILSDFILVVARPPYSVARSVLVGGRFSGNVVRE